MLKYVIMTDSGFLYNNTHCLRFLPSLSHLHFFFAFIYIHVIFKKTESKKKKRKTLKKRERNQQQQQQHNYSNLKSNDSRFLISQNNSLSSALDL